jgi:two-component system nitrogen regulation response regulator GlnG
VRRSLQRLLRTSGIEVQAFESGEGLLAARLSDFDCVLLDLHLSGTGGVEVAQHLAQVAPELPVVILTGNDQPEFRAKALQAGVHDVLTKPSEARILLAALREAVTMTQPSTHRAPRKAAG